MIVARRWDTGTAVALTLRQGRIATLAPAADSAAGQRILAPALCDIQINGSDGIAFNSPSLTSDGIRHVVQRCRRHGITRIFATLITDAADIITRNLRVLRHACDDDPELASAIVGVHLEGPYLSPLDGYRGVHPLPHIRLSDWDEFRRWQEAADGRIRLLTLAPEQDGAIAFIERATASGVVVALGHTAATGETIRKAVEAGARLATHLGNGCPAMLPRHDNPIWELLADDRLWMSVIADGWHLPASVLRCLLRVKTPARTILTSDASSLAGRPPGVYRQWGQTLEVLADGRVVLAGTPYLAGSGGFTDACVAGAMRHGGVPLRDAIEMASLRPRELFGLPWPSLEIGAAADFVVFECQGGQMTLSNSFEPSNHHPRNDGCRPDFDGY